jgi:hypothetical protein
LFDLALLVRYDLRGQGAEAARFLVDREKFICLSIRLGIPLKFRASKQETFNPDYFDPIVSFGSDWWNDYGMDTLV